MQQRDQRCRRVCCRRIEPAEVDEIASRRLDAPPPSSKIGELLDSIRAVTAALRFTEDGLETTVEIERK